MTSFRSFLPFLRALVAAACLAGVFAASAATLPVGHCLDDGSPDSLRGVLAVAEPGDVVDLRGLGCPTIELTQGAITFGTEADVDPDAPPFDLTLIGPGSDLLEIRGTDTDYLFFSLPWNGVLTFEGLALAYGRSPPTNMLGIPGLGGCVLAIQSVTLRDVDLHHCTAQFGGGVFSYIGDILAEDSRIHDNSGVLYAATGQVAGAGLMAMQGYSYGAGYVRLLRTEVHDNTATGTAVIGGAVFAHNSLEITDSVLRDNHAVSVGSPAQGAQGGAGFANANLTVTRSRLHGNTATGGNVGMGGALFGAGGTSAVGGRLMLIDSAVYDNRAAGSNQVFGGAIHFWNVSAEAPVSRIVNSTVSGNVAELGFGSLAAPESDLALLRGGSLRLEAAPVETPDGLPPVGGGGLSLWAPLDIDHATIAFNRSAGTGGGFMHIARFDGYAVSLDDSIVAANQAPVGGDISGAEQETMPTLIGGNRSIVQSAGPTVTLPAGIIDADPGLLPLAENGGPTPTHEIRYDSPALDAGANPDGLAYDQRGAGFPRELGAAADIGAYEFDAASTSYTVTVAASAGGTVDPPGPIAVAPGQTAAFALLPDAGFQVLDVGGTCGGALDGGTYTTAPVAADCTVEVAFIDSAMMPVAEVTPGALGFSLQAGYGADTATLSIANVGTGTLDWTIHASLAAKQGAAASSRPVSATARLGRGTAAAAAVAVTAAATAPVAPLGTLALSQTADLQPVPSNSAACYEPDLYTTENRYLRRFYLGEHGVGAALAIESVDVAIESSTGLELTVNLYTLPSGTPAETIPLEGLVPIGSGNVYAFGGSALTTVRVPIAAVVADTAAYDLVVEVVAPSGADGGAFFYIGSTTAPETHASFMMASECGIDEPTRVASLGFPNMHLILVVNADDEPPLLPGCDNPADIPWLSVTPASGSTPAGQASTATIGVDAATLAVGEYSAVVCVASNDIAGHALIGVPVHATVTERTDFPVADVTPASFAFELVEGFAADDAILVGNAGTAPLNFEVHTAEDSPGSLAGIVPEGSALPLSQTSDTTPVAGNSIACGVAGSYTNANSYYRRFVFADHSQIGAQADIVGVDVGVESSNGIELTVNLYALPSDTPAGTILLGALEPIGSAPVEVPAGAALTSINVPVSGEVSDTAAYDLVVEVVSPNGATDGSYFYIGSTDAPETRSGFLMAPGCGIAQPATTASLGRPGMHPILVAYAIAEPVVPQACDSAAAIPWLTLDGSGGTVAPGDVQPVALGVDTAGLAIGDYQALVCLATDDPQRPRVEIPVSLEVTVNQCILRDGFEEGGNGCGP